MFEFKDIYLEKITKVRKDTLTICKKSIIVLVTLLITIIAIYFMDKLVDYLVIEVAVLSLVWVGAFFLYRAQTVEWGYTLTNTIFDVDKITGRRKRKSFLSVDCRRFDILAPVSQKYDKEINSPRIKDIIDCASGLRTPNRWFATFENKKTRKYTILVFEPSNEMIDAFESMLGPVVVKREM